MYRRECLIGMGGSVALAGCSSVLASEEYEPGQEDSLLPDEVGSDWPDQELEADHDLNDNFDRVWMDPDESKVVMMSADIFGEIDDAEYSFERSWATVRSPQEFPLADEALISDDGETAACIFRHSNAKGQVLAARFSGFQAQPDRSRATEYAEIMFGGW